MLEKKSLDKKGDMKDRLLRWTKKDEFQNASKELTKIFISGTLLVNHKEQEDINH